MTGYATVGTAVYGYELYFSQNRSDAISNVEEQDFSNLDDHHELHQRTKHNNKTWQTTESCEITSQQSGDWQKKSRIES